MSSTQGGGHGGGFNPDNGVYSSKVPRGTFIAFIWAAVVVTLCCIVFRAIVRIRIFRKFFADDYLVLISWLILLTNVILYQTMIDMIYLVVEVFSGARQPPADFMPRVIIFLHEELVVNLMFLISVWLIKFSFLLFFRRLVHQVRSQNILWWTVTASTLVGFMICVGTAEYRCTTTDDPRVIALCAEPSAINVTHQKLKVATTFDIVTDILILAVPINLLWNVRISLRQKLALGGIFSITVLIMAVSLARALILLTEAAQQDVTFIFTWLLIEQAVAITVACLASYRALFTREREVGNERRSEYFYEENGGSAGYGVYTGELSEWNVERGKLVDERLTNASLEEYSSRTSRTSNHGPAESMREFDFTMPVYPREAKTRQERSEYPHLELPV